MTAAEIVSRHEWTEARLQLLEKEKEFTRLRDELSRQRRALPWVRVEKDYVFDGANGQHSLVDLFAGHSQLIVYHFMFAPEWEAGCKSCSFWADNFNGIGAHLNARDVAFAAVSRAPVRKLQAFARRLGWGFPWFSSQSSDFNYDYGVSFAAQDLATGWVSYNYARHATTMADLPGISVFARNADGAVFHTYSCYARGLDMLNGAYHHLDLVPKGRDEAALSYGMEWVRLHDQYGG